VLFLRKISSDIISKFASLSKNHFFGKFPVKCPKINRFSIGTSCIAFAHKIRSTECNWFEVIVVSCKMGRVYLLLRCYQFNAASTRSYGTRHTFTKTCTLVTIVRICHTFEPYTHIQFSSLYTGGHTTPYAL